MNERQTIYVCPSDECRFHAMEPGRCRSHPYPCRAMGPELVPLEVAPAAAVDAFDSRPDSHEHIAQVRGLVLGAAAELTRRAHQHDRSKLEEPELEVFDRVTPRLADSTYGSEEYKGFLSDMGPALDHHYRMNDHHPQHYRDGEVEPRDGVELVGIKGMGLLEMTEMLADWIAASRRHEDGDIRRSIDMNAKRFGYGDELRLLLHNTVDRLLEVEVAL